MKGDVNMNYLYENKLEIDRYEAERIRKALDSYLTDLYIKKNKREKEDTVRWEIKKTREMIKFLDAFLEAFL